MSFGNEVTVNVGAKHWVFLNQLGLPLIIPLLTSGHGQHGILIYIATLYSVRYEGRSVTTWSTDHTVVVPLQPVQTTTAVRSYRGAR